MVYVETPVSEIEKSRVLSRLTGYLRSYGWYPFGDYKTNHDRLIVPVSNEDPRLQRKPRESPSHERECIKCPSIHSERFLPSLDMYAKGNYPVTSESMEQL